MADLAVNPADETAETTIEAPAETVAEIVEPEKTPEQKERDRQAFAERKARQELENLRKENEAYRRRDEEAKAAAEEARRAKLTEEARIKEERDQLAAENEAYKMNSLRERIGREFNLRDEMIPRLIGTDETALRADAEDLVTKGFTKARPRVGTTTSPSGEQGAPGRKYTRAELQDHKFYQANREDIMKAQSEGRIT